MIELLRTLADIPGVRLAALFTRDGMPIAVPGRDGGESGGAAVRVEVLAALASQWMVDLAREVSGNTWSAPRRAVLEAARGTLVLLEARGAVLAVQLAPGTGDEELRLPMEGTAARLKRLLREMGSGSGDAGHDANRPSAALPQRGAATGRGGGAPRDLRLTQNQTDKTGQHQPSTGV